MFFDFDGFNLFMLPFPDAVRPAESNDCHDQQAFDTGAVSDMGVFKVKTSTFQAAKQGLDLPASGGVSIALSLSFPAATISSFPSCKRNADR